MILRVENAWVVMGVRTMDKEFENIKKEEIKSKKKKDIDDVGSKDVNEDKEDKYKTLKLVFKMIANLGNYLSSDYRYNRYEEQLDYKIDEKTVKYMFIGFVLFFLVMMLSNFLGKN